ncbi:MAG: preprotein translocase subunit SecG [Hyphomicrobiaceae bacterium]|nr:preprotein translocase subunit SecG [Hyphomicrobiaceae bacterium]
MATVLLVIHLFIALGLVGVVLLQRSEGGALGIGGSGGAGGFLTGRGTANLLTRVTAMLAAAFFVTSILLTILARQGPGSVLDRTPAGKAPVSKPGAPAGKETPPKAGGILERLQKKTPEPK